MLNIYVIANENVVRILDEVNLIKHFEEVRKENEIFHLTSTCDNTKSIPSLINQSLPNGVTNIDEALVVWNMDIKNDYPFLWSINTTTMEATFRNYWENSIVENIKLSITKEELLNINYQDEEENDCQADFICSTTNDKNMTSILSLLKF